MKTPEELAKEFSKVNAGTDVGALGCYRQGLYEGFLAGYEAAKDQVVDVNKMMFCVFCNDTHKGNCAIGKGKNHPAFNFSKIVVKIESSWVSVKDRLPEIPENDYSNRVLLLRADKFIVIARVEKCVRFVRPLEQALIVETDNGDPIEEFTHWMPLSEPPEE